MDSTNSISAAFAQLVMELTGRDMAYHARCGTTGLDHAWISYHAGVTAERERCCAILKAREDKITAEAEKAAIHEPDEVTALRAMAWQLAVVEREIRGLELSITLGDVNDV